MENEKSKNDISTNNVEDISNPTLVEKEVDMGYFNNYSFDEKNHEKNFSGGCSRISYCNCNCNDCIALSG